jgi:hypothetical protein
MPPVCSISRKNRTGLGPHPPQTRLNKINHLPRVGQEVWNHTQTGTDPVSNETSGARARRLAGRPLHGGRTLSEEAA